MPKTRTKRKPALAATRAMPGASSSQLTPLPSAATTMGMETRPGIGLGQQSREQRFNPLRSLTPVRLGCALDAFHSGYVRDAALIWDALENRAPMVVSCAEKRRSDVARRPWEIVQLDDSPEAAAHKLALEQFCNHVSVTDATDLNVSGDLSLLFRQMMSAPLQRYAVHEIVWKPVIGQQSSVNGSEDIPSSIQYPGSSIGLTAELKFVPLYLFENRRGRLAYTGVNGYSYGALCQPGEWMITVGRGIMEAVSVAWMFGSLSLKDWLTYSEKFGMPGVHMMLDAAPGSPEWENGLAALQNFANEWVIQTTKGAEVKLIEAGQTGDAPFKPMVEYTDRLIATLLRGGDLSTISRDQGAGASLQGDESNLMQQDDCALLSGAFNMQVVRPLIEHLFGYGTRPLAYLFIKPEERKDVNLEMAVDKHLRSMGAPLSVEDLLERYGRTMPDDDETLIGPEPQNGRAAEQQPGKGKKKPDPASSIEDPESSDQELENSYTPEELATFVDGMKQFLAEARIKDHASIIAELTEIASMDDTPEVEVRLAEFLAALPESIGMDAAQTEAWEAYLGSSFLNGAADVGAASHQSTVIGQQ